MALNVTEDKQALSLLKAQVLGAEKSGVLTLTSDDFDTSEVHTVDVKNGVVTVSFNVGFQLIHDTNKQTLKITTDSLFHQLSAVQTYLSALIMVA